MSGTETFQRQHAALVSMGAEIMRAMEAPTSDEAVREVRRLAARFKGALLVHQRMENDALYPRLLAHPDPNIAAAAQALCLDLGDLYDGFLDFERRYAAPGAAELTPQDYYKAIGRLLKRLFVRMRREDQELYALAQRADSAPLAVPLEPDPESLRMEEEHARWRQLLSGPPRT